MLSRRELKNFIYMNNVFLLLAKDIDAINIRISLDSDD